MKIPSFQSQLPLSRLAGNKTCFCNLPWLHPVASSRSMASVQKKLGWQDGIWDTLGSCTLKLIALIFCQNLWPSRNPGSYRIREKNNGASLIQWSMFWKLVCSFLARLPQDLCDKSSQVFPEHDLSSTLISSSVRLQFLIR